MRKTLPITAFMLIALAAPVAAFPTAHPGFLNNILNQYNEATEQWLKRSLMWASVIFSGIVSLEIVWSLTTSFLETRDIDAFVTTLIKRIVWCGTCVFILNQAPSIVMPLMQDFLNIGNNIAQASGTPTNITPDDVYSQGFQIAQAVFNATNNDSFWAQMSEVLPQTIGASVILLSYGLVAAQLLLTEIQIFVIVGAGAFLLGFIGSRWTLPYAEIYPRMVIQSGLKLVSITLVVGLGKIVSQHMVIQASQQNATPLTYLTMGFSCFIFAIIAWFLPSFMQLLSGAPPVFSASSLAGAAFGSLSRSMSSGHDSSRNGGGSNGKSSGGSNGKMSTIDAVEKAARID